MELKPNMIVTLEAGEGQHLVQSVGRSARIAIVGVGGSPIVLVDVEGLGLRGCLPQFIQPKMTLEMMSMPTGGKTYQD